MSDRDYLQIVRGLLAKAESSEAPAEADTFMAKAQELMTRHAINQAMVDADRGSQRQVTTSNITCEAPYAPAKLALLNSIATANGCQAVLTAKDAQQSVATVIGCPADLEHIELLYTSLSMQATNQMLNQPVANRRFRQSFLVGFAQRIGVRLAEAREQATADFEKRQDTGMSAALVLAGKRQEVDSTYKELFPKTRQTTVSGTSPAGTSAGAQAADRADLGQRRVGARRRSLSG